MKTEKGKNKVIEKEDSFQQSYFDNKMILIGVLGSFLRNTDKASRLLQACDYNLKEALHDIDFLREHLSDKEIRSLKDAFLVVKHSDLSFAYKRKMITADDYFNIFKGFFVSDERHERFYVAYVGADDKLKSVRLIAEGSAFSVKVYISKIFEKMPSGTTRIVLCHNHPLNYLSPSSDDISLTKKIINAANGIVKVSDHLIIAKGKYYSFAENHKI